MSFKRVQYVAFCAALFATTSTAGDFVGTDGNNNLFQIEESNVTRLGAIQGGAPLGFWFAQQGSIYIFVGLIFYYCFAMARLERKYGVER